MDLKDPFDWPLRLWVLVISVAVFGGAVRWIGRYKQEHRRPFKFFEWVGELFFCGFVGLMVFFAMVSFDYPLLISVVGAAIGGHFSTRIVFLLDTVLEKKLKSLTEL
jgi:hypothetical protein